MAKKSGCDEIELGKLYANAQQRNPGNWHGFCTAEVVSSTGERRIIRMRQPEIVFDPDETQSGEPMQAVDFVGLEEAARVVRSIRNHQPQPESEPESAVWLPLPTPRMLWRFIVWYWSVVAEWFDERK